jgi:hypothetical protein
LGSLLFSQLDACMIFSPYNTNCGML